MRILSDTGVVFEDPRAVDLLRAAGARVEGGSQRVRLDPGLVLEKAALAPREFELVARTPERSVRVGGEHLVFAPTGGPAFVSDLEGGRRAGTLEDLHRLIRLSEAVPVIHHGAPEVVPTDRPLPSRHLDILLAQIRLSSRGLIGDTWGAARARDHLEMTAILFGGRDALSGKAALLGFVNSNSPLRYDRHMTEGLLEYATYGQPLIITPFIMAGATSPVTLAAAAAQQNAETLAGIVLAQIVRPGAPVLYGGFLTGMDMRTGAPAFGRPEAALGILAAAQMARRYGLPCRGAGLLTNSKVPDAQAGCEKANMLWPLLLAGVHYVPHAAGWLDSGLVASFEQFVIDADLLEMAGRFLAGIRVDEESLALEIIERVGPGGQFLAQPHTQRHMRTELLHPALSDTSAYESWARDGSNDSCARAGRRWRQILETYRQPPLDPAIDAALEEFVERRSRELQRFTGS